MQVVELRAVGAHALLALELHLDELALAALEEAGVAPAGGSAWCRL